MDKKIIKIKLKSFKTTEPLNTDAQGIVEAYVSIFGNVDSYGEVVDKGAFVASLARKLPKVVWSHNWDQPIGTVLEAKEDDKGLYIKFQLIKGVQKADEALLLLQGGAIDEFSIGYRVREDYLGADNFRHLKAVDLYEASPVLVGANDATELLSVKGFDIKVDGEVEWVEYTVTQDDLDNNPALVAMGLVVGDVIQIPDKTPDAGKGSDPMGMCADACKACIDKCTPNLDHLTQLDENLGAVANDCVMKCQTCIDAIGKNDEQAMKMACMNAEKACTLCKVECGKQADDTIAQDCATACSACADACIAMLGTMIEPPKAEPIAGDACTMADGTDGVLTDDGKGGLMCAMPDTGKGLKAGRVLSQANRDLIAQIITETETLGASLKGLVLPLKELLNATDNGGKVEPNRQDAKSVVRIRQSATQAIKSLEHVIRVTKE